MGIGASVRVDDTLNNECQTSRQDCCLDLVVLVVGGFMREELWRIHLPNLDSFYAVETCRGNV